MSEAFEYRPTAAFRGSRDYVHSTDIYENVMAGAAAFGLVPNGAVDLRMHAKMVNHAVYRFSRESGASEGAAATVGLEVDGELWWVTVAEIDLPVDARKPYDETSIWNAACIEDNVVTVDRDVGARPIEAVTALGVLLHRTLFPPPAGKRWLLGRMLLDRPLEDRDAGRVSVTFLRRLGDATRSAVAGGDGRFAELTFILG